MMRWVIAIALLLGTPLVQPAAAYARASSADSSMAGLPAMCGDASQTVLLSTAPALGQTWQGPPLTPHLAAEPVDDGQTAWCVSPDDPRCAPRDAGSPLHTQRSLPPLCELGSLRSPQPVCSESSAVALRARLGAPRAGVRVRLERPPQV